jgi:hypothetical protein
MNDRNNSQTVQTVSHLDLLRRTETEFPRFDNPASIRSLRVWHCKYKSLQMTNQFRDLQELVIATLPDNSLSFLEMVRDLRYLSILHMPNITDVGALAHLKKLESLSLQTLPSWDASGKCTTIESLEPLAQIPGLKHLELFGICPPNKSLLPLERIKNLQSARFLKYPKGEVVRFFGETGIADQFNPPPSF